MPPTRGGLRRCVPVIRSLQQVKVTGRKSRRALTQSKLTFKTVKNSFRPRPPRGVRDERLLRLRYPSQICEALPSVKKLIANNNNSSSNAKKMKMECMDSKPIIIEDDDDSAGSAGAILGAKKRRGEQQRYKLELIREQRLSGMIWDVAFSRTGNLVVCTTAGASLLDQHLKQIATYDGVVLPGGVAFLSAGHVVLVCRNSDTVNIYTELGEKLRSFDAGHSPMTVAVSNNDVICVTDVGDKCLRMYSAEGELLNTVPRSGDGYTLEWPLYVSCTSEGHFTVVDSHRQLILVFNDAGQFSHVFSTKTLTSSSLIKPHGIAINSKDDVFVVDIATSTVEVFTEEHGFLQTLLSCEDGALLRPKVLATNRLALKDADSSETPKFAIGTLSGLIKLYEFTEISVTAEGVIILD